MEITHHSLKVPRTAHIYTSGNLSDSTNEIWILLHGYSQLAGNFIRQFANLADDTRLLIAPQGLSQFYISSTGNRTAASWMTRSHREDEINDYLNYLDHVLHTWIDKISHKPKIYLLGFSQGAETASRWFVSTNNQIDHLIIYGGLIPKDIDIAEFKKRFSTATLSLIHGSEDRFIPTDIRDKIYEYLTENNIPFNKYTFSGGHRIDIESVRKISSV